MNSLSCYYKMSLNGRGIVKVKPDIAIVLMGVVTENKSLKIAQEENSLKVSKVIQGLNNSGIPSRDIKTERYNIEEEYDNVDGKQVFRVYKVSNILKVTIRDIAKVGEVIDLAVENGANLVTEIDFQVSLPERYYNIALERAIKQAVSKAEAIRSSSRIMLNTTPISIIEESSNYLPIYGTKLSSAAINTPISPGEIEIAANIKAIFQYVQY